MQNDIQTAQHSAGFTPAGGSGVSSKWKVGDMARYVTRSCLRMLILEVCHDKNNWGAQQYCCMSGSGTVCYHSDQDLLTLEEWLNWWERFRDETIPKEWRECAETARLDFVPPAWWPEAVERATEPYRQNAAGELQPPPNNPK